MATLSDYVSGTISLTNGSIDFTGAATGWLLAAFKEGDTIIDITGATEFMGVIAEITSNTAGKLTKAWEGPNLVDAPYRMRYEADGSRVSAQARNLIELLGDGTLTSLAGLSGPGVIELLPGGGAQVVPKTDLVSGANYDVQVADLVERATYDGQAAGFSVLVSDVGDGRAAIYSKASNASADWTDPAFVTGPVSTVPGPVGVNWRGAYDNGTAYAINDGVQFNGSSFRKLTNSAAGNAPSGASPPVDNTHWAIVAAKGQDGTGTGDVVGPASSVDLRVAVWDGLTGKLLKDGGKTIAQILAEAIPPGYDDLQFTVSQIALAMADALNVAQFLGPSGNRLADSFDALTYVDVAGATNLDTSSAGLLKPTQTGTVFTVGVANSTVSFSPGYTQFDRTTSLTAGWVIRSIGVYLDGAQTAKVKIGKRNSAGNYDVVVDQTIVHPGGGWADVVLTSPYTVPGSGSYVLGAYAAGQVYATAPVARSTKAGDVGLGTGVTGFTEDTNVNFVLRATYNVVVNNLTVRSAAFTAAAVPTKMKALINVKEVDAAAAGTDYTLECSRDSGTTWTAMTLTERYTLPTTGMRVVEAAETDVSGQPSGTAPRWRFKTLNNKNVELHDVYLYWS